MSPNIFGKMPDLPIITFSYCHAKFYALMWILCVCTREKVNYFVEILTTIPLNYLQSLKIETLLVFDTMLFVLKPIFFRTILPAFEKCLDDVKYLETVFKEKKDHLKVKYGRYCMNHPKVGFILNEFDIYFNVRNLLYFVTLNSCYSFNIICYLAS